MDTTFWKKMQWIVRIGAILIVTFGLPFYFGYGNPLPFTDRNCSPLDNLWLMIFPVMFVGLLTGLRFPRIGGYLTALPVAIGLGATLMGERELITPMVLPFLMGLINILVGYKLASEVYDENHHGNGKTLPERTDKERPGGA
jgi:hypothetical protein